MVATYLSFISATVQPMDSSMPDLPVGQEWKLTWADEFQKPQLDTEKWEIPEYKRRDAQWSKDAVEVKDGHLIIKTFQGKDGKFYDACVRTRKRFEHTYGFYTARIRLHKSPGHWPAFWLYNDTQGTPGLGGKNGVEIDIMEKPWLDDRINIALHWDGYGTDHKSEGKVVNGRDLMIGWHTYSLWWTPEVYVFYIDGKEVWRTDAGGICQVPLYIKLSDELELKGWAGELDPKLLPDSFAVDYVRVYDVVDIKTKKRVFPVHPDAIPKP